MTAMEYVTRRQWRRGELVAWAFILFLYFGGGYLAYALLDTGYPLIIEESSADTPIVEAGTNAEFRWKVRKVRSCDGQVTRYIVDEHRRITFLDLPTAPHLQEGNQEFVVKVPIPEDTPPGIYRYVVTIVWRCSPIRSVQQSFGNIRFEVWAPGKAVPVTK